MISIPEKPVFKRHLADELLVTLADTPVVLLNGARQAGKSTLVKHLMMRHQAQYFTLDRLTTRTAAQSDPEAFITHLQSPVILDEVQKAPELFDAIKLSVDEDRVAGRFLLTGSTNIFMQPKLNDSLAGRMAVLTLWPLSQGEIRGQKENFIDMVFQQNFRPSLAQSNSDRQQLIAVVVNGGYPEVLARTTNARRKAWFEAYLKTILERDVRDLAGIERLSQLPSLVKLLAARVANLHNTSEISRSIQIPNATLVRYLSYIEATFLIYLLPAWSNNFSKRVAKSPKLFFTDTGLAAALLGLDEERLQADPRLFGQLLENFVVSELNKQQTWSELKPKLFHFRTTAGQEVDVILENANGDCVAIEIKAASNITPKMLKGIEYFKEHLGKRFVRGIVLYTGRECLGLARDIFAIPINRIFMSWL